MPIEVNQKKISPSVNPEEVAKFSAMAEEWWDTEGKFKPLHKFNPVRVKYIKDSLVAQFNLDANSNKPLKGLKILDIGCGGGLLSIPLARLGAEVTAIDASEKNINIAMAYSEQVGVKVNYLNFTSEELSAEDTIKFDAIVNMEVVEHVQNLESFMKSSCEMLKQSGLMFVATMNRTAKSYAMAIIGAEYVMQWLPRGTHDWNKFLKPSEVNHLFGKNGLKLKSSTGVSYSLFSDKFSLSDDLSVNYILVGEKG